MGLSPPSVGGRHLLQIKNRGDRPLIGPEWRAVGVHLRALLQGLVPAQANQDGPLPQNTQPPERVLVAERGCLVVRLSATRFVSLPPAHHTSVIVMKSPTRPRSWTTRSYHCLWLTEPQLLTNKYRRRWLAADSITTSRSGPWTPGHPPPIKLVTPNVDPTFRGERSISETAKTAKLSGISTGSGCARMDRALLFAVTETINFFAAELLTTVSTGKGRCS